VCLSICILNLLNAWYTQILRKEKREMKLFKVPVRENEFRVIWENGRDGSPTIVPWAVGPVYERVLTEDSLKNPPRDVVAISYVMDATVMYHTASIPLFTIVGEPTEVE